MWCCVGAKLGMRAVPIMGHPWGRKVASTLWWEGRVSCSGRSP